MKAFLKNLLFLAPLDKENAPLYHYRQFRTVRLLGERCGKTRTKRKEEPPMNKVSLTMRSFSNLVVFIIILIRCGDSPGALLVV